MEDVPKTRPGGELSRADARIWQRSNPKLCREYFVRRIGMGAVFAELPPGTPKHNCDSQREQEEKLILEDAPGPNSEIA